MPSQPKSDPGYVDAFWDLIQYDDCGAEVEMENGAIGKVFDITSEDRSSWPELARLQIQQVCLWTTDDGLRKFQISSGRYGRCFYCGKAFNHHIPNDDLLECP